MHLVRLEMSVFVQKIKILTNDADRWSEKLKFLKMLLKISKTLHFFILHAPRDAALSADSPDWNLKS